MILAVWKFWQPELALKQSIFTERKGLWLVSKGNSGRVFKDNPIVDQGMGAVVKQSLS